MNPSKTLVICDSGCDVALELAEKYDIRIVQLGINYHDRSYTDTQLEKEDPLYVYTHFKEEIPKTASLSMAEVLDVLESASGEGYENVIGITISGAMSSTYNAMRNAVEEFKEDHPDAKTFVFDTKNISIGSGIFAIYAAYKLREGLSFEEVTELLQEKIYDVHLGFYMDTLEYLRKGGRITPSVALVGKLLNIKPIISCNHEGTYYTVAKIRGAGKGVSRLVDYVLPEGIDSSRCWLVLLNGDGLENLAKAKEMVLNRYPDINIIEEKQIVSSMAIHTGPGLVGMMCFDLGGAYKKDPIQETLSSIIDTEYELGRKVSESADRFSVAVNEQKDKLSEAVNEQKDKFSEAVTEQRGKLTDAIPEGSMEWMTEQSRKLTDAMTEQKGKLTDAMTEQRGKLTDAMTEQKEKLSGKIDDIMKKDGQ